MSTTRHMTAMPISTGLPRQSLIFWRELLSVMILREIFLFPATSIEPLVCPAAITMPFLAPSTSPLWLSFVFAAGLTAEQNGFT